MATTAEDWSLYWQQNTAYAYDPVDDEYDLILAKDGYVIPVGYDPVTDNYYKISVDAAGRIRTVFGYKPVYHYIHKPNVFEIVLQSTGSSTVVIDTDHLINLSASDSSRKVTTRAFFPIYSFDLTELNRIGVMWYNDGSGTGTTVNQSNLYAYTGSVASPVLTHLGVHYMNFGSFAAPVWDAFDISSLSGSYNFMVEAKDNLVESGRLSDLHIFFIYLWKETTV